MQFLKTTWTISTRKESLAELTSGIQVPEYTCVAFRLGICLPTSPSSVLIPRAPVPGHFLLFLSPGTLFLSFLTWLTLTHPLGPRLELPPPGSPPGFPRSMRCFLHVPRELFLIQPHAPGPPTSSPVCLPDDLLTGLALQGEGASNQDTRCYAHSCGHQDTERASQADAIR